jgi:hypothetical protein
MGNYFHIVPVDRVHPLRSMGVARGKIGSPNSEIISKLQKVVLDIAVFSKNDTLSHKSSILA